MWSFIKEGEVSFHHRQNILKLYVYVMHVSMAITCTVWVKSVESEKTKFSAKIITTGQFH